MGRGERLRSRAARSEPGDLQQLPGHSQGTPCNYRPQNFLLLLPISSSSPGPHAAVPSPLWVSCRGLAGDTDATGALTAPLPPGRARGWAGGCGMGGGLPLRFTLPPTPPSPAEPISVSSLLVRCHPRRVLITMEEIRSLSLGVRAAL